MKTSPKLLSFVLLLVCAGLLSPGLHAAGKVKLGLHLQKGSSYNVRMVTDQKITSKFGDKDMEMIQNIALGYTFAVQDVDGEGNASIQTTYATVKAHLEGPMGTSDYDSAQPSEVESPVGKVLAALAGQSFMMKLASSGKVLEVTGMSALMERILGSIDLPEGQAREGLINSLKKQYSDQAAREQMGQLFAVYPETPVSVGDSWAKSFSMTSSLPMNQQHTWTLKSLDSGKAVIQAHTVISTNAQAPPLDFGSTKLGLQISGEQDGTLSLDPLSGWVVGAVITLKLSGEYKFEGGTDVPAGMTMPMTVEATIRLEPF